MPRENSFSDEGRSLTPDLDDALATSPSGPLPPARTGDGSSAAPTKVCDTDPGAPPPNTPSHVPVRPTFSITPGSRFRASVHKVMRLHRTSSLFSASYGTVGAEPGIDPRRESAYLSYGHIRQNCVIDVVDYSSVRHSARRMTNGEFVDLMNDSKASQKESWVKVRWINIGGISWDVISSVAIKYGLHPLAVEDMLHNRGSGARSKADYYPKHLFLRILCHSLARPGDDLLPTIDPPEIPVANFPRSTTPTSMTEKEKQSAEQLDSIMKNSVHKGDNAVNGNGRTGSWNPPTSPFSTRAGLKRRTTKADIENDGPDHVQWKSTPSRPEADRSATRLRQVHERTIDELKKGERVNVNIRPIYIFLTREGTVISFHPTPNLDFTAPIGARLCKRDTMLRTSAEPSLLLQSLLDLIVDQALEVVDEYQGTILKLEQDILMNPKMKTMHHLHVISGDLILHKRTLGPVRSVIYGLRRYDQDRCAALIDTTKGDSMVQVEGFISQKAKIYLADVLDHMEYILASLDMFESITENLITYTFNMKSYDMGQVMRRLTLATIIFLPLTLLTGYFGMNFTNMWSTKHTASTDVTFWIIALPVIFIVLVLFMHSDIVKAWHYIKKKTIVKKAIAAYYGQL